jgi:hypothetical protein
MSQAAERENPLKRVRERIGRGLDRRLPAGIIVSRQAWLMALTFDCHGQQILLTTLTPGCTQPLPLPKGEGGFQLVPEGRMRVIRCRDTSSILHQLLGT